MRGGARAPQLSRGVRLHEGRSVANEKEIRLLALVGPMVGKQQAIHKVGTPNGPQTPMPYPEVLYLETDQSSCMLYRYTLGGQFCGDTWHATLEDAKSQAEFEYEQALGL